MKNCFILNGKNITLFHIFIIYKVKGWIKGATQGQWFSNL